MVGIFGYFFNTYLAECGPNKAKEPAKAPARQGYLARAIN